MSARVARDLGRDPAGSDALGFVFPVYGWRIPRILSRFIAEELPARLAGRRPAFVWAVMTCGDDVGYTDRTLDAALRASVGYTLDAAYSVNMPDTYLGLPGFRLDSPEEQEAKFKIAVTRLAAIRESLAAHARVRDLKRGPFPRTKTVLLGGFFDRFLSGDRRWRVDGEKCTRCGLCVARCPTGAILTDAGGRISWSRDGRCTGCFRCYHNCPSDAISCGRSTRGKGRLPSSVRGGVSEIEFHPSGVCVND